MLQTLAPQTSVEADSSSPLGGVLAQSDWVRNIFLHQLLW